MQFKVWYRRSGLRWFGYMILSVCALIFFGFGFIVAGIYLYTVRPYPSLHRVGKWTAYLWLLVLGLWWLLLPDQFVLWSWYFLSIPLAALGAEVIQFVTPFVARALTTDLDEMLAFQRQDNIRHFDRLRHTARRCKTPRPLSGYIPLAPVVEIPEAFPHHTGIMQHQGWLYISETALSQHMFVQGAPGSGKTEMLKWLICQVLQHTAWDVFIVDGKGDEGLAQFLVATTARVRGFKPRLFQLGHRQSGDAYNAFIGSPQDVYNRLVATLDNTNVSGGAAYYANANKTLLQLICYAPCGPPLDFAELEQRLHLNWLTRAYRSNKQELRNIMAVKKHLPDLAVWLQPLIRDFKSSVNRHGFCFDHAGVGIFSVRTQSAGETSRQLLNILNADLLDFMGKRQQRPTLVVIDEFQAFKNEGLAETLSLGRSSNLAIVLATQDTASITNKDIARRILANTRIKNLMATDFPEEVGQIAGTREILEHSYQHDVGEVTGVGTSRQQHQHQISLNDVARLEPGEGFIIRQRFFARVLFRMVEP